MRLVAYDPQRHGSSEPPLRPSAMRCQMGWLEKGSALTVYIPPSEQHPRSTSYSAGSLKAIAWDREDAERLADPADRRAWLELLCGWAQQLTEKPGL